MTIDRPGIVPPPPDPTTPFRGECAHCGCVLRAVRAELTASATPRYATTDCPTPGCGRTVVLSEIAPAPQQV